MSTTSSSSASNGSSTDDIIRTSPGAPTGKPVPIPPPTADEEQYAHYHSYFSSLLAWENPRASAIAYASIVTFILAVRYLDVLRWGFKLTWVLLGISLGAEIAGKLVLGNGLASQFRPKKYYTVSRETLDLLIGDVHDLVNFLFIESQRIFFAENIYASAAACIAAFVSYFLVKVVPYWGLALIATSVMFITPLIYASNQELIDAQIKNASDVVNAQTAQLRQVAGKHASHASEISKQYVGDYTARAQQYLRGGAAKTPTSAVASAPSAPTTAPSKQYSEDDFPAAPKKDLAAEKEPLVASS